LWGRETYKSTQLKTNQIRKPYKRDLSSKRRAKWPRKFFLSPFVVLWKIGCFLLYSHEHVVYFSLWWCSLQ
jgi:hypothetical protein